MRAVAAALLALALGAGSARATSYDDFNAGIAARNHEDWDSAIALLSRALSAGDLPGHLRSVAYLDRALAYKREDKLDLAIADDTQSISLRPDLTAGYLSRANAYERARKFDLAMADYTIVLRVRPSYYEAYAGRAMEHRLLEQYRDAEIDLDEYLKYEPRDASAYFQLGMVQWASGRFGDAGKSFDQALKQDTGFLYAALWRTISTSRASGEAPRLNMESVDFDGSQWPRPLLNFYLGRASLNEVSQAAAKGNADVLADQKCEAEFYLGEWQSLAKESPSAGKLLQSAATDCTQDSVESLAALSELKRLPAAAPPP